MPSHRAFFLPLACAVLAAPPAWAADAVRPDGRLHPGAHRLDVEDFYLWYERFGPLEPGTPVPLWAERWAERERAIREGRWRTGPAAPEAARVGPNVDMSSDPTRIHSESFIAVDRQNPLRLVAGSNQINADSQMLFWSGDGGSTWGSVEMALGTASFHSDPGVAWDARGNAYSCSLGIDNRTQIQVVKSGDGGRTWSATPVVVHEAPLDDKELMAANDRPGTSCENLVCVAWDDASSATVRVHVACAVEATGTWTDRVVASSAGTLIGAVPAFGPDGEVYAAWLNGPGRSLDIVRSDDCGQSWSAPLPLARTRIDYDFGIIAMCGRRVLVYPAIDVDRSSGPRRGWVYAVWSDATPGSSCPACPWPPPPGGCPCDAACEGDVYFARSEDGGLTWSAPVPVHDPTPGVDQFNPWLAVNDADGAVHVMWYDTRNDPTRRQTDVYLRRSPDGGTSWEPEVRVTTAMTDETSAGADSGNQYGDYNGIAAFQCSAWPVWTDRRRGGSEQIFTAQVTDGSPFPPAEVGNTLLGVADAARDPALVWTDSGPGESDYRVYRGDAADFVAVPPLLLGPSGGPDQVRYTDAGSPTAAGVWFYRVRPVGPCGEEAADW